jgi:CRISPR-associated protein Cmr6
LTVEDTTFQFLLASKEEIDSGFLNLFKEALTNHGIGAKTAVGYGYFR